jgi:DNA-binding NarL/FixJ family response regulator
LREVAATLPTHPPIILITGHGDKETAIKAVHFGAFDFLEKPFAPRVLDNSIERALVEKKQDILNYKSYLAMPEKEGLTAREKEVAYFAADGLSNEEIAERLELGTETVKTHLKKIFRKLGVDNRTSLSNKLHNK